MASPSLFVAALCALAAVDGLRVQDAAAGNVLTADVYNLTNDILAGVYIYATENNLTTVQLPDVEQDFSVALWILSLSGRISLTKGTLSNFQKIDQHDKARVTFDPVGKGLVLGAAVQLPKLKVAYTFRAKVGAVKQKGQLSVSVDGTTASAALSMNMDELKPQVTELKVLNLGSIGVDIDDGVFGWLATPIANLVAAVLGGTIRKAVQNQLPALINEELAKLDIADMLRPPADLLPPWA